VAVLQYTTCPVTHNGIGKVTSVQQVEMKEERINLVVG